MLGRYENFPETIHGVASFTYKASAKTVQQAILSTLLSLSRRKCSLEEIARSSPKHCEVGFEFGVGEDTTFTFLDQKEQRMLESEVDKKALTFLDFLCVLRYHVVDDVGKRSPLKFDYYFLRFVFGGRSFMEFLVSHERGPRRVNIGDLMDFLTAHVERELAERHAVSLKLENKRAV